MGYYTTILLSCALLHLLTQVTLITIAVAATETTVAIDRLHARLSYVRNQERVTRQSFSYDPSQPSSSSSHPSLAIQDTDTLIIQASFTSKPEKQPSESSSPFYPQQAFLRLYNKSQRKEALYIIPPKSQNLRLDLDFAKEFVKQRGKKDDFFTSTDEYSMEIQIGDTRMQKGFTWVLCDDISFESKYLVTPAPGVFDFDHTVHQTLLPEFSFPLPLPRSSPPTIIILLFSLLIPLPLIGLFYLWNTLSVFPLTLPKKGQDLLAMVAFQICIVTQIVVLVVFWMGVGGMNIMKAWKWLGGLMLPTFVFGNWALKEVAKREMEREKGGKGKKEQ